MGTVMDTAMETKTKVKPIWHVLYTKPRNEKKVFESLVANGVECYYPTQKVLKQWSDRKKWIEEPLFKSYIFVKAPESMAEKLAVLQSPGVVRFLFWLGKEAEVKQSEIDAIRKFLGSYETVEVVSFEVGTNLEISDGALKGMDGIVDYQTDTEVVLKIDKLGMSLVARLSKYHVKKKG